MPSARGRLPRERYRRDQVPVRARSGSGNERRAPSLPGICPSRDLRATDLETPFESERRESDLRVPQGGLEFRSCGFRHRSADQRDAVGTLVANTSVGRADRHVAELPKLRGAGAITCPPDGVALSTASPRWFVPSGRKRKTPSMPAKPDALVSVSTAKRFSPCVFTSAATRATAS